MVIFYIAACSQPPKLVGELQWLTRSDLDTMSTFFLIELFEDTCSHPNSETHTQAAALLLTSEMALQYYS